MKSRQYEYEYLSQCEGNVQVDRERTGVEIYGGKLRNQKNNYNYVDKENIF